MVTIEQVQKLCACANVSYAEAKKALEAANEDILEALIALEREGKAKSPRGCGHAPRVEEIEMQSGSNEPLMLFLLGTKVYRI